ncbi:Chromatin structure-remodeling complex protein rsc9 [Rhodotorula kratochvilovae]
MSTAAHRQAAMPSSSRVPYSQPGVAKAAVPRGQAGQAQGRGSARAGARQYWSRVFGGPHYLDPGPSNRLVLSIRSDVAADVDFGLDRLVQVTSVDPDLVRLGEMPGLLDGCLALIADYIQRRRADRAQGVPALSAVVGEDSRDVIRRRAGEAALILRNVAPESRSREPLLASRKLKKAICDVLDEGESGALDVEETTEVRLYLLDVLECIAEHIPLALPGHPIAATAEEEADENRAPPAPEPADSPSVRLFPLLVSLTRTKDRALILAGFRCLSALALNDKSDSVFALLTYDSVPPLPKPHPHPIQTAIELLPIADAELNLAILEFVYQHTLLPSNAVLLAARPELLGILRLLCGKFHVGSKVEEVEIDLSVALSEAKTYRDSHGGIKHPRKPSALVAAEGNLVTREELAQLIAMPEPSRALTWMRLVYEVDPQSDVSQVALWQTYQAQWAPHMAASVPPMLPASDVIKVSQQAIPGVLPMVVDTGAEKKFVIRGLRLKERPELLNRHRCRWAGCKSAPALDTAPACYHHIYDSHLAASPRPMACAWHHCNYASAQSDPALILADLSLHIRTHLSPLDGPDASDLGDGGAPLLDLPHILHHERFHTYAGEPSAPGAPLPNPSAHAGIGYFAALSVRNLSRVAKLGVDASAAGASGGGGGAGGKGASGSVLVASGNSAIGRLAGEQTSIFEAFAAAAEGSAKKDGVRARLEKVDFAEALPLAEALVALQPALNATVMSDVALGKVLGESVLQVEECRRALLKLRPVEAEAVDVAMQE